MNKTPTKAEILAWIAENPTQTAKRDIAKAFGIKGTARIDLKRILKELEDEGHLRKRRKTYRDPEKLPPVGVLSVMAPDQNGDLFAKPLEWAGEGRIPRVLLVLRESDPALGPDERILANLREVKADDHEYEARLIRKIGSNPLKLLGVFRKTAEGGHIKPIDKGSNKEWLVRPGNENGAKDGELVEAEQAGPRNRLGLPMARIITRLGDPSEPRAVSLIAIHQHGIPDSFPDAVIDEADAAKPAGLKGREDLRDIPLITIDPADARDHDDAVWAEFDTDPANKGGFVLWVAIADVAHYVTPGSALDREAWNRGNSTYFPDRVVPMLPDRLSGDLCSLHEGVPRACLAVRMVIDADGKKRKHTFKRGLMKSAASLSYAQVQQARDGDPDEACAPLMDTVINPLFESYEALKMARQARQPLDLDLPERKIILGDDGRVQSVALAQRFDAHKLIEEFMVLANVAAAEELFHRNRPLLYRVHEEPSDDKLDALREVAAASGFTLAKGQVLHTSHLNRLLAQAEGTDHDELINISTLRSMTQAYYHPDNFGHFGLALRSYAHFTSPIRRYADLIVHRALIAAHGWGKDGLSHDEIERLEETAKHISETERRSMSAERDTNDRYLAAYLNERIGTEMTGHISGIQKFGAFIKLDETGADGLVPVRSMGAEFFHFDSKEQTLMGADSGRKISIGQSVVVRIADAVPVTGGLELELISVDGDTMPRGPRQARGRYVSRKANAGKAKRDKTRKKVQRRRK
ncbi:ribonuclease R [Celeribacter arenosi]|uniref:Ribonuclease R n=1 Tax=Celeribacter arenosi TaxID=792649 RepID=A0ABP7JYT0_9RHOB